MESLSRSHTSGSISIRSPSPWICSYASYEIRLPSSPMVPLELLVIVTHAFKGSSVQWSDKRSHFHAFCCNPKQILFESTAADARQRGLAFEERWASL